MRVLHPKCLALLVLLCGSGLLNTADLFDRASRAVTAMRELSLFFSCRFSGAGAFLLVREGTASSQEEQERGKGKSQCSQIFQSQTF